MKINPARTSEQGLFVFWALLSPHGDDLIEMHDLLHLHRTLVGDVDPHRVNQWRGSHRVPGKIAARLDMIAGLEIEEHTDRIKENAHRRESACYFAPALG